MNRKSSLPLPKAGSRFVNLPSSNILLVEGHDDLYATVGLMQHHVEWPDDPALRPVEIKVLLGIDLLLNAISPSLKISGLKTLGIMIDGDNSAQDRYRAVRNACIKGGIDLPEQLAPAGLVHTPPDDEGSRRVGVWIMPDNMNSGSMETFLTPLVKDTPLLQHANDSTQRAISEFGAGIKPTHREKAILHTWLAWQDPPGQGAGLSLTKRVLDPHAHSAAAFVRWFMRLYGLPPQA